MKIASLAILGSLSIVVAAACSPSVSPEAAGGTSGGGGGSAPTCAVDDAPITAANFKERLAAAFCNGLAPCCKSSGLAFDASNCAERIGHFTASISPSKPENGALDPTQAAACVENACQATRSCPESGEEAIAFVKSCSAAFTGTLPPGAPCARDVDCAAASGGLGVCNAFGSCSQFARGKAGDACVMSLAVTFKADGESEESAHTPNPPPTSGTACTSADGLLCDLDALSGPTPKCVALGSVDAACVNDDDCTADLRCKKPDPMATKGKCAAKIAAGGSCDPHGVNVCVAGAFCDPGSSACAAQADVGGSCRSSTGCKTGQCSDGKCADYFVNVDICSGH